MARATGRLALASGALGVGVFAAAFIALCIHTGNPWPWHEIVHEAGDRSLLGTLFYFEHAARELPLDLVLAVAIAASVRFAWAGGASGDLEADARRRRRNRLAGAGLAAVGVIVAGTLLRGGPEMLLHNFAQMHTRPGAALSWGAHWRYHLLSRATLMLVSLGLAGAWVVFTRGLRGTGDASAARWFAGALAAFGALTLLFAPDLDPFTDPVFIGHQVREVLTHALVTLPAGFAVCLWLAAPGPAAAPALAGEPGSGRASLTGALAALAVGCGLGLYLLVAGLALQSGDQGQTQDAVLLVAPHFFEHGFSYLVVALVAGALHEQLALRAG